MYAMYTLSDSAREHALRHFEGSDMVGSLFHAGVFPDPVSVVECIQSLTPGHVYVQPDGIESHVFTFENGASVGTTALALRSSVPVESIRKEVRGGFAVDVAQVDALAETQVWCVVVRKRSDVFEIVTMFPGNYALPFPTKAQDPAFRRMCEEFWLKHVLLGKK
jgi:hypothetical protein